MTQVWTADDVLTAVEIAQRVTTSPEAYQLDAVRLSRGLLRLREAIGSLPPEIRPGARLRVSVKLMRDLYDMPDHESVTVRLVRVERGHDGVGVLVLASDDRAVVS